MRKLFCVLMILGAIGVAAAKNGATTKSAPTADDGEQTYKTNCTRCHSTPPALSARQTRVVVRHMRVRANLPARDAEAVLRYLLQSDSSHSASLSSGQSDRRMR